MKTQIGRPRAEQSLTTTLALAFFTLSAMALLVSGGLQLFSNFHTHQAIIVGNQQLIAQEAAQTVSCFIQEKFIVLEAAVGLVNLDEVSRPEQEEVLSSLLGRQPAFRQLAMFNDQGQALALVSRLALGEPRRFSDQLEDIMPGQDLQTGRAISPVSIDPVTSEPLVMMAVPIVDVFGDFRGTLLAEVNLKFMWDLIAQLRVGETGHAYVVDRDGNLIAFGDMARVLRGENLAHLPVVSEFIHHTPSAQPSWVEGYQGIMGAAVVGTYAPLKTPDWAVVTEIPWAETYQDVIREAVWASGIILAIATLASLLGVYLARRLVVPLVNLTRVATQIAGGEQELQAVVEGPREVASLAVAFNSMTTQLRQSLKSLEQEVTERRHAEESLRQTNETLQALVDHSPLAINMINLDSQVLLWNRAAERMYGWTAQEVLGEFLPNVSQETLEEHQVIRERVTGGKSITNLEIQRQRKDGSTFWLALSAAPLRDSQGNVYAQISIAADITERKQAESEREAMIAELETQNAELERFTYTVSHDLKSPLITIGGFVGFLEQDALSGDVERMRVDIAHINDAVTKMQRLLDDLLELSRVGRQMNPPEEASFAGIAREAVALVQGRIAARGVEVEIAPDLPAVYGDRARLVEVVQNLVDNAVRFMGDQSQPRVEIGARQEQDDAVFYVRDNGIGIEPQYHDKVFGLFEKLDPASEGTGVGLALVKRIIETHEGKIWVESEGAGRGSTFYFTFPAER